MCFSFRERATDRYQGHDGWQAGLRPECESRRRREEITVVSEGYRFKCKAVGHEAVKSTVSAAKDKGDDGRSAESKRRHAMMILLERRRRLRVRRLLIGCDLKRKYVGQGPAIVMNPGEERQMGVQ